MRRLLAVLLLAVVAGCGGGSEASPDLTDVTWGDGQFVVVGLEGRILTSPDGTNWQTQNPGEGTGSLLSVVHFDDHFLAAGAAGQTVASTDGITWEPGSIGTEADIFALAHEGGVGVVAVGSGGSIFLSERGVEWEEQQSPVSENLLSVAWGAGGFVAVGDAGSVLESRDGRSWEVVFEIEQSLYGITFASGRFLGGGIAGTIVTRTEGGEWSEESLFTAQPAIGFGYGRGIFVIVGGSGVVYTAPPGFERISGVGVPAQVQLNAVVEGNDTFVTVGQDGGIFTSRDAVTWRNFST